MSMNLHCNKLDLWQTPTQITYMCLVQPDNEIASNVAGKKARHALAIYRKWVEYNQTNIINWQNEYDCANYKKCVEEHLTAIDKIAKAKDLELWVM
jgi:thiaminase